MTLTSLRTPIRHFHSLNDTEQYILAKCFQPSILVEKTDGMAWEVGCDDVGTYTRTSHGPKIRKAGDYFENAKRKFGAALKPEISEQFDCIHYNLLRDLNLISYLQDTKQSIKGEIFWIPSGKMVDSKTIQFVGTGYDINEMGLYGTFVIHSQMNCSHPCNQFLQDRINWKSDFVEQVQFADTTEQGIRKYLSTIKPKWGLETEGYVIYNPCLSGPVKVIDKNWAERRKRI